MSVEPAAGEPDCKVKVEPGLLPVLRSTKIVPGAVPGSGLLELRAPLGSRDGSTTETKTAGSKPERPVKGLPNLTRAAPGVTLAVKCRFTQMLSAKAQFFGETFVYVILIL